jgi:hypothetical protein
MQKQREREKEREWRKEKNEGERGDHSSYSSSLYLIYKVVTGNIHRMLTSEAMSDAS